MANNLGVLRLQSLRIERRHSFVEYIFGGCEVSLSFAIDFTGSNGVHSSPSSLHSLKSPENNQYMQAIKSVGDILQFYNHDK